MSDYRMTDTETLKQADAIIRAHWAKAPTKIINAPELAIELFKYRLATLEHEEFHVAYLNNRHALIERVAMFRGTIDSASVYPREVVKHALKVNAAAVILAHNHPSGNPEPSRSDLLITDRLKEALALVDVRVLDHVIISSECLAFSQRGLL